MEGPGHLQRVEEACPAPQLQHTGGVAGPGHNHEGVLAWQLWGGACGERWLRKHVRTTGAGAAEQAVTLLLRGTNGTHVDGCIIPWGGGWRGADVVQRQHGVACAGTHRVVDHVALDACDLCCWRSRPATTQNVTGAPQAAQCWAGCCLGRCAAVHH